MCGIAGFCLSPNEHINARKVSSSLLRQIQSRGKDATGAAWVVPSSKATSKKSRIVVSKAPVPASMFDPYLVNPNGMSMPVKSRRVILHTRYATQGDPIMNTNNHPIVSGRIVGVHNGHLSNDDAVFNHFGDRANRVGQVDSEAAFALLDLTRFEPEQVLRSLEGRAALAWFNGRDKRDLHLARVSGSPLAIGGTEKGSFFFASTLPLLVKGCEDAGVHLSWVEDIAEGTYLRVRNGEIIELEEIGKSKKVLVA